MIKFLPKKLTGAIIKLMIYKNLIIEYFYDMKKYAKYSTSLHPPINKSELEARLIAHYHVIEKGLSMRDTRFEFGQDIIFSLISLLNFWKKNNYPTNNFSYLTAISALKQYIKWHEKNNIDVRKIKNGLGDLLTEKDNNSGGVIEISKEEINKSRHKEFNIFLKSRHSIRNFKSTPVPISEIKKSVELAGQSPSACNRQSIKTYLIQNRESIDKILKIQGGSRGFGHMADKLLVITADLCCFHGVKEKNLSSIDGGIFAMSLMLSLHYNGIDSCALSWPSDREKDKGLRQIVKINNSENIILLLAIGYMDDEIKIPKSTRKPVDDIFTQ